MKINGKEIIGCGIIETALDGLSAKEFCICVTYKKERKNGRGAFDVRRTTLPEIVRRNNDLALAIPEYVAENMSESRALNACASFAEKYGVQMLPIEKKRLDDLKAAAAAKKAAAANESRDNGGGGEGKPEAATKKPKKTASERIADIVAKMPEASKIYKFEQLFPAMRAIDADVAAQVAEIVRRAYIPAIGKMKTSSK